MARLYVNSGLTKMYQPADGDGTPMFEIEMSERFGDIIKYGVKLVDDYKTADDALQSQATFSSITVDVSWDTGAYSLWQDQFYAAEKDGTALPIGYDYDNGFDTGSDVDVLTFSIENMAGITFEENEYVAEFMLQRTNTDPSNYFELSKAQYTIWDVTDTGEELPEQPGPESFDFRFDSHNFDLSLENKYNEEISHVEVLVTDIGTTDGLSIVPVAKNGNIIKYEIVMNVPKPVFITELPINPNHMIEIRGAEIFKESIMMRDVGDLLTEEAASLLSGASISAAYGDGGAAILNAPTILDTGTGATDYTGQEFFHKVSAAFDPSNNTANLGNLATTDTLTMEVTGLVRPALAAATNGDPLLAEGRYVIAEFHALDLGGNSAIAFVSDSGTDSTYNLVETNIRTITRHYDDMGEAASGAYTQTLLDGSEAVVLADNLYVNENVSDDAVGGEDALGAAMIAAAELAATGSTAALYSNEALIGADFNQDGRVSAADAAAIMRYTVHGEEPGNYVPEWVYVDKVDTLDLDAENVRFDPLVNEFAYNYIDLDVTAVLRGDMTSSYTNSGSYTSMDAFTEMLEAAHYSGQTNAIMTKEAAAGSNEYYAAGTAAVNDVFRLGSDTGIHYFEPVGAGSSLVVTPDVYAIWDYGDWAATFYGDVIPTSEELLIDLNTQMALEQNVQAGFAVYDDGTYSLGAEAYDLNGDGTIAAADDLVVVTVGATGTVPFFNYEIDAAYDPSSLMIA